MRRKNSLLIKVLSLGVGLAVGIVLIAKVFFELSYDSFYKDIDRVYTIYTWFTMNGDETEFGQVSGGVAVGFMDEVPGVEAGTRVTFFFNGNTYLDENGNKLTAELVLADTCFFKVFDRPILAGDPVKALSKWGTVMVSRSFADKLATTAGDYSSVIGKQIYNEDRPEMPGTIEGVYEDFPDNGSFGFDILLSMETYYPWSTENWLGNDRYKGFVKLAEGVDPNGLKDAIRKMQEAHQPIEEIDSEDSKMTYFLRPFNKIHTSDPKVKSQVVLLSIVAVLLILISLLNYILIVISSMVKRSKEVGVMKCYGAESKNIYGMLTSEALLHIVLSLMLAAAIIFAGRNIIENLLGVPFQTLLVTKSIVAIAVVILLVLIISIVVPAELYQRIPVYAALKNYTENSRRWKLGLLGIQVLINVFLVIMMVIIGRQYDKISHSDPGYDYRNLYYFNMFDGDTQAQARAIETLRSIPEVKASAASYNIPCQGSSGDNVLLPGSDEELFNIADQYECSDGFYELMGIQFVEGRAPRDSSEMVVDEKFVKRMADFVDWSDGIIGKQVYITGHENAIELADGLGVTPLTISGVYKSYLIGNLQRVDPRPNALFYGEIGNDDYFMPHIMFRVSPDALPKVMEALSKALDGRDIDIISYEQEMRAAYADTKKMSSTMILGVVFSLLIALLGLIGFIRDESLRRSKEMAIRKINGATTRDILGTFAWEIMRLSLIMAAVACAATVFVAQKWLEQFAERVTLNPLYFICGTVAVLAIILVVVVLNCLKIAWENPVVSLKNE